MTFESGGFFENSFAVPSELAEMGSERHACETHGGRRAAAHSERDAVVDFKSEGSRLVLVRSEGFAVDIEKQVAIERPADLGVPATGVNRKSLGFAGVDFEIEIQSDRECIETGTEIRRSCRETQMKFCRVRALFSDCLFCHCAARSRARRTWSTSASSSTVLRRVASISARSGAISSSRSRSPRWYWMV